MSQPSRRVLDLSPAKRALLESLFRENGIDVSALQRIPPRTSPDPPQTSFAQQRLWFLDQLLPGNPLYNIPAALRLKTPLNVSALRRSLNEIARRHKSLRTTFALEDGQTVQVIAPELDLELPVIDLRGLAPSEREAEAQHLAALQGQQPFDLAHGPLVRVTLLQLADADFVLVLVMHHIVTDGWSMGVFFREMTEVYRAFAMGRPSPLLELPIQYADYAVWQRQWLDGEVRQRQVDYWKEQLADLPLLELPTDRPRPAVQSFRGAQHPVRIEPALAAGLKQLSQREGVTLFMTLLAAFQTLLARYTGQDDIVVGSPIAGRNRAELEPLIGFFVNTLVLRTDLSGDPSFVELLTRVRQVAMGAYAHQDLPFEMLVEELHPERDLSRNPLFQVTFQLLNTPTVAGYSPDSGDASVSLKRDTAKFDLACDMFELPNGAIIGQIEYNTDLFEPATIDRMATHLLRLLDAIVADPATRLSDLPLLTESERAQLLLEWSGAATPYPHEACIHELFYEQARRDPHAIAVVYGDEQVTYRELAERAGALARQLQILGVEPNVPVGVFLERSVAMVVAFLAVLKAGGAYVPLDVTYPSERIAFMVEDTHAPIVVTDAEWAPRLPPGVPHVLRIDAAPAVAPEAHNRARPTSGGIAYVMYTSGSTGQPKGAYIPHRAVVRLVRNTNYVQVGPGDCIAQISNSSFDAATFEIWGALLNGAKLAGISKSEVLSGKTFRRSLEEHAVTTLFITTSLFNQLVSGAPDLFRGVRTVLMGGTAADPRSMRAVLEQGAPERFMNVYGPTEGTTFTTFYPVHNISESATNVPIGRPISNTRVYILDPKLRPVPVGVAGELYIAGDGLALGYLNRPELTAEKFVPNPFSDSKSDRLYRTGDRVRYLADGNIEFLGRFDDQVKIRGFRVEPGEIEAVLRGHPDVRQCLVVVREAGAEDHRIIAYIVADATAAELAGSLRVYAAGRLPDYMIPAAFVFLDTLPLSVNGKVDRSKLPDPGSARPAVEQALVEPRTALERTIASVWKEVLGLDNVGVTDNFFDLGGHSLLLVRLHSRLQQTLGRELPMTDLFRYTTISALAEHLTEGPGADTSMAQARERARKQKEALMRRAEAMKARQQ